MAKKDYNAINFKNKDIDKFSGKFNNGDPAKKNSTSSNTLYVSDKNDPAYTAYADSLDKYKSSVRPQLTGKKSFGEYGSFGIRGKSVKDKPLPEGYKVEGTNQPIAKRVTTGYYPDYVVMGTNTPGGKDYRKVTKDLYKEPTRPVVVDKEAASKAAPKPTAKTTAKPAPKAADKSTQKLTLSKDASIAKQQIQLYGAGGKYSKKP